ncbi:phospholipase C/P1 nuclease domain-containing protein [Xylogone sp. PMI_703]|nr:phospholipase C/P1 nuclease domain-containing protein [Xylogone sp. PMI_703]
MRYIHAVSALSVLSYLPNVYAWGSLGHQTVAYIATNFVTESTKDVFQELLYNKSDSYLAGVATWADSYRYTKEGHFSAPFHFIDAEDEPPQSCSVKYSRDCGKSGCVISAIQNYTRQILDTSLHKRERSIASKFIIHFLGDIHQPLHAENLDIGGNGIKVNFSGVSTNLHSVWDTAMPEKLVGGYSAHYAREWAANLSEEINSGSYASQAATWLQGIDLSDSESTALLWAGQTNAYVCTTVMPDGLASVVGQELSGSYYESCVPVIKLQVARAGYRLAAWLNLIADTLIGRDEEL